MIEHLHGRMTEKTPTHVVIDCGGVGYFLNISLNTFGQLGDDENVKMFAHLAIRDDAHVLYGFFHPAERELFRRLISVSGVGAATAMMVLSTLDPAELQRVILEDDVNKLKSVKGIGAKTAQRIILDLRDKLEKAGDLPQTSSAPSSNTVREEALSALLALGFDRSTSGKTLDKILSQDGSNELTVERLLKTALQHL